MINSYNIRFPRWGLTNRRFETNKKRQNPRNVNHQGKVHVSQIHIDAALPYSRLTKSDKQKNAYPLLN